MKKKYFYFGLLGLALFEILNVYFIMPMPGSQEMNSINIAYFFYSWRWIFRIIFFMMIALGLVPAFSIRHKWLPAIALMIAVGIVWLFNFKMTADKMFLQPHTLTLNSYQENKIPGNRIIVGIENNGEAKAYPISFLAYHHQVRDVIGGKQIMVTYCSVCRTGRVYEPVTNGKEETFRLVGMDHFNAMFEDATTKSWWRQATGEAITGPMKGNFLPEVECMQLSLDKWLQLHPESKIMQPDQFSLDNYDSLARFEQGKSRGSLTMTDSISWNKKSWVIGVVVGKVSKAYDWNDLKKLRAINDTVGTTPVVVAITSDEKGFAAFERSAEEIITMKNDTLFSEMGTYDFSGNDVKLPYHSLKPLHAYQEFWHSWRAFHPETIKYVSGVN